MDQVPAQHTPPAPAAPSSPSSRVAPKRTDLPSNLPAPQYAQSNSSESSSDPDDPHYPNRLLQLPSNPPPPPPPIPPPSPAPAPSPAPSRPPVSRPPASRSPARRPRLFHSGYQQPPRSAATPARANNCHQGCCSHHNCSNFGQRTPFADRPDRPANNDPVDEQLDDSDDSDEYEIEPPRALLWRSLSSAQREHHLPKASSTGSTSHSSDDNSGHHTPKQSSPAQQSVIPSSPESPWSPAEIQRRIRQISRDPNLSEVEKNKRRQMVLSQPFQQRKKKEASQFVKSMNAVERERSFSNVIDPETGERMLGCEHYPRNCKIRAACCDMWVVCRLCHDDPSLDHAIDRFATKEVMCMKCWKVQEVSEKCTGCGERFARYFCPKCKFYDNTPGKDIYHCDKCGICRVGKGIGFDNFHCDRCNACVSMEYSKNHRCLKRSLDADCPICGQYLFTSTKPVVFMRCGHTMHSHCFDVYTEEHFTCPLCHKALTNMKAYYAQIDEALKREVMPAEHRNKVAEVLCHDCDERSETAFHFLYLKCRAPNCGSYNTRLLRTFVREQGSAAGADAEVDVGRGEGGGEDVDGGDEGDDEMDTSDSGRSDSDGSSQSS